MSALAYRRRRAAAERRSFRLAGPVDRALTYNVGKCSKVNVFVEQEPRLRARMCGRRSMQQQRVHEDDVARRGSILDDLERYTVYLFDTAVEASDTGIAVAIGAQVVKIRVSAQGFAQMHTTSAYQCGVLGEPLVHEPVGAAKWTDRRVGSRPGPERARVPRACLRPRRR